MDHLMNSTEHLYTKNEQINDVSIKKPHLVILGAGASLQAFPNGDKNGKKLPLMNNLVEVCELDSLLDSYQIEWRGKNFEIIYSELKKESNLSKLSTEIESKIYSYFSSLELPDEPTLYDHLVLSLRKKDKVATFNWDPFLFKALKRNYNRASGQVPNAYFLHGNVAIGFCAECNSCGQTWAFCSKCNEPYLPTPLLYPIESKNYVDDEFISKTWTSLKAALQHSFMLTIFGYGAPDSDKAAIKLFQEGWGNPDIRALEEVEIIDIRDEKALVKTWKNVFIHSHHYSVKSNFYNSQIAQCPRRSVETLWARIMDCKFHEENPMAKSLDTFEKLEKFIAPLIEKEISQL